MKLIYKISIRLLALSLAIGSQTARATEGNDAISMHYNSVTDSLSIRANGASQMELLRRLALQTGLEASYDEQADQPMTIELTEVPLESGLKQLLRGTSHILSYGKDEAGKKLLVGVIVLPAGGSDPSTAHPLLKREAEANYHAGRKADKPAVSTDKVYDHTQARWGARMAEMPPEVQARLQRLTEEKLSREQRKETKQQKKIERLQERKERVAERKHQQVQEQPPQQWQDKLSPEQRAEWEQSQAQQEEQRKVRKEEQRQQIYQQLGNQQ